MVIYQSDVYLTIAYSMASDTETTFEAFSSQDLFTFENTFAFIDGGLVNIFVRSPNGGFNNNVKSPLETVEQSDAG